MNRTWFNFITVRLFNKTAEEKEFDAVIKLTLIECCYVTSVKTRLN